MAITAVHPSEFTRPRSRWVQRSLILTLGVGVLTFWLSAQTRRDGLVGGDGLAYFLYARSMVVDLDTNLLNDIEAINRRFPASSSVVWAVNDLVRIDPIHETAELPWPIGAGLLHAPFYLVGFLAECLRASFTGTTPDTYGWIPQVFFCLGSLVYGWLGFLLTSRLVSRCVPGPTAWIASAAVFLATPAMFYVFFHPSMSHAASFALTAGLMTIWWPAWHDRAQRPFLLGTLLGMLAIVRYQNALLGLLLVAVTLRELRRAGWRSAARFAAIGLLGCALPLGLEAWHLQAFGATPEATAVVENGIVRTGFQSLDLSSPHWLSTLTSARHGAFYWSPLLLIATLGLAWSARRTGWARLALAILAANVFLIGSIEQWWGGSSFGMRYLVECTPFFALGLAVLLPKASLGVAWRTWAPVLVVPVIWNACLALAFGLRTIEHSESVTFGQMWIGIGEAFRILCGAA